MMHAAPIESINRKIAAAVLVIGLSTMIGLGILRGAIYARSAYAHFQESLDGIDVEFKEAVSAVLWVQDLTVLKAQLQGIVADPEIAYAAVIENGKTVMELGERFDDPRFERKFPLEHAFLEKTLTIGTLVIHGDEEEYSRKTGEWLYRDFPIEALGIILLCVFLYFYVDGVVTARLRRDARLLDTFMAAKSGLPFPSAEKAAVDEIDFLESQFNAIAGALMQSYGTLSAAHAAAEEHRIRYKTLFKHSPIPQLLMDYSQVYTGLQHHFPTFSPAPKDNPIAARPERLLRLAKRLILVDVNEAFLNLVGASSMQDVALGYLKILGRKSFPILADQLHSMSRGERKHQGEGIIGTLAGDHRHVQINWLSMDDKTTAPYSHVIVSLVDFTVRNHTQNDLAEKLKEREVLIRELFHRTKNNMQNILSFISMESWRIEDSRFRETLRSLETRIYSMSLVHRMLYEYNDLSKLSLSAYLREFAAYITAAENIEARNIRIELAMEEISVSLDIAMPVGLVVSELIANSLKHAFPEKRAGIIRIALNRLPGGQLELLVQDNGVGTTKHFDPDALDSLGLQLVASLAESQLGGAAQFGPSEEGGFGCRIVIRPDLYEARV
jgi:two-component sensor histidine kinase